MIYKNIYKAAAQAALRGKTGNLKGDYPIEG